MTHANGGGTTFTYDASGNLTSLTDPDGNTTTWTYNDQDQLIQETDPLGTSAYYSYDSAGNLTNTPTTTAAFASSRTTRTMTS